MAKLTLNDFANGDTALVKVGTLNNNNSAIETALENTLSRDGTGPNAMNADLDMNGHRILNELAQSGTGFIWEGDWTTSTLYEINKLVSNGGNSYICVSEHTSGVFATDLADGKWELLAAKGANGAGSGSVTSVAASNHTGFNAVITGDASVTPTVHVGLDNISGVLKGDGLGGVEVAIAGSDFLEAPLGSSLLKANNGGALLNASPAVDYLAPPSGTAIQRANLGGALVNAIKNIDYKDPIANSNFVTSTTPTANNYLLTIDSQFLTAPHQYIPSVGDEFTWKVNAGNTGAATLSIKVDTTVFGPYSLTKEENVVLVSGDLVANTIIKSIFNGTQWQLSKGSVLPAGTGGTVTSVALPTANGFAATITNPTTAASIALKTTVTGLLKSTGSVGTPVGISSAVAGTDYIAPPSGTAILKANSGGALQNAVAGTDYVAPLISGTSKVIKTSITGALVEAVANTDYVAPGTFAVTTSLTLNATTTPKLLGRTTASVGPAQEITVTSHGLSLGGSTLSWNGETEANTWTNNNTFSKFPVVSIPQTKYTSLENGPIVDGGGLLTNSYNTILDIQRSVIATTSGGGGGITNTYSQIHHSGTTSAATTAFGFRSQIDSYAVQNNTGVTSDLVGFYAGVGNYGQNMNSFGFHVDVSHNPTASTHGMSVGVATEFLGTWDNTYGQTAGLSLRNYSSGAHIGYGVFIGGLITAGSKFKRGISLGSAAYSTVNGGLVNTGDMNFDVGIDLVHAIIPSTSFAIQLASGQSISFAGTNTDTLASTPSTTAFMKFTSGTGNIGMFNGTTERFSINMSSGLPGFTGPITATAGALVEYMPILWNGLARKIAIYAV